MTVKTNIKIESWRLQHNKANKKIVKENVSTNFKFKSEKSK